MLICVLLSSLNNSSHCYVGRPWIILFIFICLSFLASLPSFSRRCTVSFPGHSDCKRCVVVNKLLYSIFLFIFILVAFMMIKNNNQEKHTADYCWGYRQSDKLIFNFIYYYFSIFYFSSQVLNRNAQIQHELGSRNYLPTIFAFSKVYFIPVYFAKKKKKIKQ